MKWYCLLYYRRFPLLCIKRDAPCQLQINCHFHFLNFPTVSSLLHIRKILVHWPFLEITGLQKWVVGATLALKQKFLAGTLIITARLFRAILDPRYETSPSAWAGIMGISKSCFGGCCCCFEFKYLHQN